MLPFLLLSVRHFGFYQSDSPEIETWANALAMIMIRVCCRIRDLRMGEEARCMAVKQGGTYRNDGKGRWTPLITYTNYLNNRMHFNVDQGAIDHYHLHTLFFRLLLPFYTLPFMRCYGRKPEWERNDQVK